ncbi:MAG: TonB-dependent receptor [Hyphomonadaceae bacterium]|nr:TonB-dependent receptor [Hyphomonadaceae bacterium]
MCYNNCYVKSYEDKSVPKMGKKMKKMMLVTSTLVFAPLLLMGAEAFAQGVDSQDLPDDETTVLKAVTVTSQRREQAVTDVPIAISAFSGEEIQDKVISDPVGLADITPGLSASFSASGAPSYSIRGVGLEDFIGNNTSGTAVYVDEVYPVSSTQQAFQLFDLERVEVLKGPQGTLYGRNATGGAISFITAKPSDELESSVRLRYDTLDQLNATGVVSGPISEETRGRVAVNYAYGTSAWQKGVRGSEDAAQLDKLSARAHIDTQLGGNVYALFTGFVERNKSIDKSWQADDRLGLDGVLGIQFSSSGNVDEVDLGPFFSGVDGTDQPETDNLLYGANARFEIGTGIGKITSISAYQVLDRELYENNDGTPARLVDFLFRTDVEQFSQEFRINADPTDYLTIVGGVFFGYDTIGVNDTVLNTDFYELVAPAGARPSDFGLEITSTTDTEQETTSLGAYLHTEWRLSEKLGLTAAGRVSHDDRTFSGAAFDDTGYLTSVPGAALVELEQTEKETNFSWRLGFDYDATENTMLYASAATGFKSGVFFSGPTPDPGAWGYVEPEELLALEVGVKSTLNRRLYVGVSAFHYDYSDKQTLSFVQVPLGAIATLGNIEDSTVMGGEVELQYAMLDSLNLNLGVAYLDSEIDKAPTMVRGLSFAVPIANGARLTQTPEWTANAALDYAFDLSDTLEGDFALSLNYTDEKVLYLADPLAVTDSYYALGFRLGVGNPRAGWQLALIGRNITDEDGKTFAAANLVGNQIYELQEPASLSVELKMEF